MVGGKKAKATVSAGAVSSNAPGLCRTGVWRKVSRLKSARWTWACLLDECPRRFSTSGYDRDLGKVRLSRGDLPARQTERLTVLQYTLPTPTDLRLPAVILLLLGIPSRLGISKASILSS